MIEILLRQILNGLSLGSVYALIAVGYSLVYSILLFSNFAHGGFLVVGGYICYYAMLSAGMDITTAAVSAMAGAGVVAVFTDRLAYRPIRERSSRTIYLMIASMGINIVIENIFVVTVGGRFRALPAIFPSGSLDLGGIITASYFDLFSLLISAIFLVILQLFLIKTKWGLAIRAAAYNLRTAGLMGVNVNRLIAIVFFVAGVLAAVGGIFLSARYTLYPQMGGITIKAFIAAVIGGLGSLPGAVMGSLVLGLAEMLTTAYISSQFRDILVFSMLILTLLFKPTGFFNKQIGEKV
ncbi:branched-chain amino acid ABC transporter permease [Cloacibacillus porcorum]|jgi:branched-chain amino acid transport system permease protein|uniref:ABC transporter permease n=1 Tax=Cloacibacillus porcorum TaxID=1197717 RepID=A0A1B2I8A0_9BACT|nr:branched-chain amino acid ABC transporter permease [Cloacibacillus porcorum]ANZ46167.1 ABC transporter permease [Cloacibacillus porcorum]MDD7648365.1 branched-chain amino acid ABC transporter permease [Cloacibacillus porcorum]MDY4092366.1 branched-chain amino acid ABC transporter permease [Cloacibacillus porcorum]